MSSMDPPPGKFLIDGKESSSNTIHQGEEGANEEIQIPLPMATRFPIKLMQILDENAHSEVIHWLPHGRGFLISNKKRFAEEILPKYFKESKYTSFTRRLNRWNFVIQTHGRSKASYFHPSFVRDGDHNALLDMQPQPQTKKQKSSKSPTSSGGSASGTRKGRTSHQVQQQEEEDPPSLSSGGKDRVATATSSMSSSLLPSSAAGMMGDYSGAAAAMYGQQQHPQYPSQEHFQQLPMLPIAHQQAHQMMQHHHQAHQQHHQNLMERGRSASNSGTGSGSGGYHPSGGDSSSNNDMNSSVNTASGMVPLPWNPQQQQQHPQQPWNNSRQPYGPYYGSYDGGGGTRGSTSTAAARNSSSSLPANSNQSAADASGAAIVTGSSTANNTSSSPPHYFHNNSNPYFPFLQGGQGQGGGPGQQHQGGDRDRRRENRDQQSSGGSHHYGQHQQFEYDDGRPSGGSNLPMRMQGAASQQRSGGDGKGFYNRNYFSQHSGFPGDFNGMMRSSNYGTQPGEQTFSSMANPPRYSPFPISRYGGAGPTGVGGGGGNPQQPQPYSPSYNQQQQSQQTFPPSSYGRQYGDFSRQAQGRDGQPQRRGGTTAMRMGATSSMYDSESQNDNRGTHADARQGQSQTTNSNSTMRAAGDTGGDVNIMMDPPLSAQPQENQEGGTYPNTGASTTYPDPMSSSGFGFSADQCTTNTSSGGSGAADPTMNQFFDPLRGHIASSSGPESSQMQQAKLYGAMGRLPNVPTGEPRGYGDNFPLDSGNVITIGRPSSGVGGGSNSAPNNDVKDNKYAPLDHIASGAISAPSPLSLFDDKPVPYKSEDD